MGAKIPPLKGLIFSGECGTIFLLAMVRVVISERHCTAHSLCGCRPVLLVAEQGGFFSHCTCQDYPNLYLLR